MGQGPEAVLKTADLQHFQDGTIITAIPDLGFGYGIGFQVVREDGYVAFGHGGDVAGYSAMLLINRKKEIAVVALSNGAVRPGAVTGQSLDILSK